MDYNESTSAISGGEKMNKAAEENRQPYPKGFKNEINIFNEIIPPKSEKINSNYLKNLRISKDIPSKELVLEVRKLYPKYDKSLQSKCERGEDYGIELRRDALNALFEKFAPEQLEAIKHKRGGYHRLKKSISCRLEDDEYEKLIKYTHEDGFDQMQAWLTWVVRNYLKKKAGKEGNNGQV